jgi:hypothetical protein
MSRLRAKAYSVNQDTRTETMKLDVNSASAKINLAYRLHSSYGADSAARFARIIRDNRLYWRRLGIDFKAILYGT